MRPTTTRMPNTSGSDRSRPAVTSSSRAIGSIATADEARPTACAIVRLETVANGRTIRYTLDGHSGAPTIQTNAGSPIFRSGWPGGEAAIKSGATPATGSQPSMPAALTRIRHSSVDASLQHFRAADALTIAAAPLAGTSPRSSRRPNVSKYVRLTNITPTRHSVAPPADRAASETPGISLASATRSRPPEAATESTMLSYTER